MIITFVLGSAGESPGRPGRSRGHQEAATTHRSRQVSDAGFDHDRYLIDPHFVDQSGLECLSGQVAGSQGDVSFSSEGLRLSHINGLDDTVEAGGLDQLTAAEKINFWQRFEAFRSRLPLIDHASIANAEATDLAGEYCFSNLKLPLTRSLQLCPTEAASRVRAAAVGPRPSTEGEAEGPVLPQLLRRTRRAGGP